MSAKPTLGTYLRRGREQSGLSMEAVSAGSRIVPRLVEQIGKSAFRQRFEAKGRYNQYLAAIPTYVITAQLPAFRGLTYVLGYR